MRAITSIWWIPGPSHTIEHRSYESPHSPETWNFVPTVCTNPRSHCSECPDTIMPWELPPLPAPSPSPAPGWWCTRGSRPGPLPWPTGPLVWRTSVFPGLPSLHSASWQPRWRLSARHGPCQSEDREEQSVKESLTRCPGGDSQRSGPRCHCQHDRERERLTRIYLQSELLIPNRVQGCQLDTRGSDVFSR